MIDRVRIREEDRPRLAESSELALTKGEGLMRLFLPDDGSDELFSEKFACPEHGTFLEALEPRAFSFNSPYGACRHCSGLGHLQQFGAELIVPDNDLSISQGAIAPLDRGAQRRQSRLLLGSTEGAGRSLRFRPLHPPGATCRRRSAR